MATQDKHEFDVVIVGSGAGGLTTALVAAHKGLKALVVEKASVFGGTTAYSGGGAWIPNNPHMHQVGQTDSREEGAAYIRSVLGNYYDDDKVGAYLDSGPEMVSFLEERSRVEFYSVPLPDYRPDLPNAKVGRTILAREFDGRSLGSWLKKVRNVLPGFAGFGTMQSDPAHIGKFKNAFRTREGFLFSAGRFANFLVDLARFGKGAHMANGNALVGRLLGSALDAGVTLWNNANAVRTILENGVVVGLIVNRRGKEIEVRARRGVVLASGGFGGNKAMTAAVMPHPEHHVSVHPESNVGDGIAIGKFAGGSLPDPNPDNGVWAPVSVMRDKTGKVIAKYPHFGPDRGKPGSIIVNEKGLRFANEASPYQDFVNVMNEQGITTAYFIGDHAFLRNYGMGIALPAPLPYRKFVRNGYLIEAPTIRALASKLGIDHATLQGTIDRFNQHALDGKDPQFHRGENIYDNAQGDFEHKPNPNVAPLRKGPYYALPVHPGDVSTIHGFNTSVDAEVLRADGTVVQGLFAVGLDQNSVMRGFYPGGGSSIGPAMTFGYRAALKMAHAA